MSFNTTSTRAGKWTDEVQANKETAEKLWCYAREDGATEFWAAAIGNSISETIYKHFNGNWFGCILSEGIFSFMSDFVYFISKKLI